MRVLRIETDRFALVDGTSRTYKYLRPNRYGAFLLSCVDWDLMMNINSPRDDFGFWPNVEDGTEDLFFAFTPEMFFRNIDLISSVVIVAECEVEPEYANDIQVAFRANKARFISEIPLKQLVS